jgi:SecD/SecF fusion protein
MSLRPWWKVVFSLLCLGAAWYEITPVQTVSLEDYAPRAVIGSAETFAPIHREATERLAAHVRKDDAVPAERKAPTYFQALRDIGEGRGRDGVVELLPFFFDPATFVREPEFQKRNLLVLKELLRRSQGKLKLGLDLQGGVAFTLEIDTESAVAEAARNVEEAKARLAGLEASKDEAGAARAREALARAEATLAERSERGGVRMIEEAARVMDRRVNATGVAEPVIRPVGDRVLEVQMPGADAANNPDLIDSLKKPAKLEFRQVYRFARPAEAELDHSTRTLPVNPRLPDSPVARYEVLTEREVDPRSGQITLNRYYVATRAEATGKIITSASGRTQDGFAWFVDMKFTSEGDRLFGDLTERIAALNRPGEAPGQLAIVLDGVLQSAPTVQSAIRGGGAVITGRFSMEEAAELANVLNNPLEFPMRTLDVISVGPSLAKDAQAKSVMASAVSVGMIILFLVAFYAWGGAFAFLSICLNLLMVLGAMAYFQATITLPGVAALVLTAGMAVDANILIFERIREERSLGKDGVTSLVQGYDRAFWSIVDANLTTLLTALILILMGTGPVKGFGVTLAIGIFATLLTALVTCRGLQELAQRYGFLTRIFGLPSLRTDRRIDFLRWAKPAFVASWILILGGLAVLGYRGKEAFGKDFRGGESAQLALAPSATVDTSRIVAVAASVGLPDTTATTTTPLGGGARTLRLETELTRAEGAAEFANVDRIVAALTRAEPALFAGIDPAEVVLSREAVGASVSRAMIENALWSFVLALLGIGFYVALRFEAGFGAGALVSTLHDVLLAVGLFVAFGGQFNASMVAAILMVMGYSINDTIVIFDRVRENLRESPSRSLRDVINLSLNQTLPRTVLTSTTTLTSALALWAFGAGDVRLYGEIFVYGVLVGTFSSVFIAAPVYYWWHGGRREGAEAAERERKHSWEAGAEAN